MSETFDFDKELEALCESSLRRDMRDAYIEQASEYALIDFVDKMQQHDEYFSLEAYSVELYRAYNRNDEPLTDEEFADAQQHIGMVARSMVEQIGRGHDLPQLVVGKRKLQLAADYLVDYEDSARPLLSLLESVNNEGGNIATMDDWEIRNADMQLNHRNAERERIYRLSREMLHELLDPNLERVLTEKYGHRDSHDELAVALVEGGIDLAVVNSEATRGVEFTPDIIEARRADVYLASARTIAQLLERTGLSDLDEDEILLPMHAAASVAVDLFDEIFDGSTDD